MFVPLRDFVLVGKRTTLAQIIKIKKNQILLLNMRVTLIGAGNMGGALAHGWLQSGEVSLTIADKNEGLLRSFAEAYPQALEQGQLRITTDNRLAASEADVLVLVVKPWLMPTVIAEIRDVVDTNTQLIVSDAANFTTGDLEQAFGRRGHFFYVIPNIAAQYGASMSFVARGAGVSDAQCSTVVSLYGLCGEVLEVQEQQVAAGMMMASCGIAYVMRMVRAMSLAGVEMGFYPQQAQHIAEQTMAGAVALLRESGLHPEAAIDKVTTPGGVTIKGLNEMDMAGFNAAVIRALKAGMRN